jgi:hypothetical protein
MTSRPLFILGMMALLASLPSLSFGVSVITKDGQTFTGKVLDQDKDFLLLELEDGVQVRIGRDQIEVVQKDDEMDDPDAYKRSYPVVGLTLFYPAWGNLVAGYYFDTFGAKVSGGYWGPETWGVQLDLSLKLAEEKEFLNNLSLIVGAASPKDYMDKAYVGVGVDVNAAGFLLEGALVNGKDKTTGDFAPVFIFQMGYVMRLD